MTPTSKEEAQRWLLHAGRDLGFARLGLELGGFYSQTCFMAHQSAEKALKSLLYLRGARYISDEPIVGLLARAADASPALNRYAEVAGRLDKYYRTPPATLTPRPPVLPTSSARRSRQRRPLRRARTSSLRFVI